MNIDTSLLRELFSIEEIDTSNHGDGDALKFTVPSTRMSLNLQAGEMPEEPYVIRTGNMHSCTRFAALMVSEYDKKGPLLSRSIKVDWQELWDEALSAHERLYNEDRWVALYHKGQLVYTQGDYHPFIDVIEKCDTLNQGNYKKSITMARDAFSQAGKIVKIDCESHVALVALIGREEGRCSFLIRKPGGTVSCNFTIKPLAQKINIAQGLSTAADFFEGIALAYIIGKTNEEAELELLDDMHDFKEVQSARKRLGDLNATIGSFENRYTVRYRPERPDFEYMIDVAERHVRQKFKDAE